MAGLGCFKIRVFVWIKGRLFGTGKYGLVHFILPLSTKKETRLDPQRKRRHAFSPPLFFLHFCIYIRHPRPDPITKRISAVPPSKWWDVSYICLPIDLLAFLLTAEEGRGEIVETGRYTKKNYSGEDCLASFFFNLWPKVDWNEFGLTWCSFRRFCYSVQQ